MKIYKVITLTLTLAFVSMLAAPSAQALCSPSTLIEDYLYSDSILIGKVSKILDHETHFTVKKVYKGEDVKDFVIHPQDYKPKELVKTNGEFNLDTEAGTASYNTEFEEGVKYLVFAKERNGYFSSSGCSNTQEFSTSKKERLFLYQMQWISMVRSAARSIYQRLI